MAAPMLRGIAPPERDPLERFWRLQADARALVATAACLFILLLGVKGRLSAAVYAAALAPGVLLVRAAVRRAPGAADDGALARSALAGMLFTMLILEYETLVDMCVSLITAAASAGDEAAGVAAAVWLSFAEAFLVAAACEEWVKLRLARRALHFEGAAGPTALLLHAAAASAAFATLENVFYLNFRAADARGAVSLVTLFVRCVLGVPAHVAWGVASAASLAMHHFGVAPAPALTWAALGRALWPSLLLHGLWDFLLFLDENLRTVIWARCARLPSAAAAPSSTSSSDGVAALLGCADADEQVAALIVSLFVLSICILVGAVVLPCATAFVCRRRVLEARALEARLGGAPGAAAPPAADAADAEVGAAHGAAAVTQQAPVRYAAACSLSEEPVWP